jgi:hypothetical protein
MTFVNINSVVGFAPDISMSNLRHDQSPRAVPVAGIESRVVAWRRLRAGGAARGDPNGNPELYRYRREYAYRADGGYQVGGAPWPLILKSLLVVCAPKTYLFFTAIPNDRQAATPFRNRNTESLRRRTEASRFYSPDQSDQDTGPSSAAGSRGPAHVGPDCRWFH